MVGNGVVENLDVLRAVGWLAAVLLVLGNIYTPYKWLRRIIGLVENKSLLGQLSFVQRVLLDIHCYGNLGAAMLSAVHTYFLNLRSPHSDLLAWLALALMIWLSLSGIIIRSKYFPSSSKKASRLVHAQYVLAVLLVVTLAAHILTIGEFEGFDE